MTITLALVLFAVTALVVILFAARGRSEHITDVAGLQGKIRPVDILAFRNLVDRDAESFASSGVPCDSARTDVGRN